MGLPGKFSRLPKSRFTTDLADTAGRFALYDNSSQTFDHIPILPEPVAPVIALFVVTTINGIRRRK